MAKYKVGDKVTVNNDLRIGKAYGCLTAYAEHCSKRGFQTTVEAKAEGGRSYLLKGCGLYSFSEEMLISGWQASVPQRSEYEKSIIALMDKQHEKGILKYGETLEDNKTLCSQQRVEHLEEELIDALQYCEHIKGVLTDSLSANDYQRMALRTASKECRSLGNVGLGLSGEAGECTDLIKKHIYHGHELDKKSLINELGDVLWYIAVGADVIGVTLEDVMMVNIAKLKARYPQGFDKARTINRPKEE